MLILYTDGLTDAKHDQERFGEDRLSEVIFTHGHDGPNDLIERLMEAVTTFADLPTDDIALVAVRTP